jgi:tetratricopeptide (TPR) repeat protein
VFTAEEARELLGRAAPGIPVGDDADAATRIVERCGRLPLAVRLVSGHMSAKPGWTLTDHADWLDDRHQARRLDEGIELALSLSYQHLPAERQRVLRLLALHPGDDLDAYAAAAVAGTDLPTVRTHLDHLHGDHLLQQSTPGRYALHDLIRAYAITRAQDEDRPAERRAALTRLFDHYLGTSATAMDTLFPAETHRRPRIPPAGTPTPDQADPDDAREWLDTERPTLVAVAAHTAAHGWPTHTSRLSRTLYRYLEGGLYSAALAMHGHALAAAGLTGDPAEQAHAQINLGVAHLRLGRYGPAVEHLRPALALFRQAGDPAGQARTLTNLGLIEILSGRHRPAADHYTQSLALHRQAGDRIGEARALANLGDIETLLSRPETAADHYRRALTLFREAGDRAGETHTLSGLGYSEVRSGQYGPAGDHLREVLTRYRQLGHRDGEASALDSLGLLHTRLGRPGRAAEFHEQALAIARETGSRDGEAWALNGLGEAARADGRADDAVAQHTAALAVAADIGSGEQQARAHTGLGHAHQALGDPALARSHDEQAMALYVELDLPEADELRARLGPR